MGVGGGGGCRGACHPACSASAAPRRRRRAQVSRSLAACQGAVLLVDAAQGVQVRTVGLGGLCLPLLRPTPPSHPLAPPLAGPDRRQLLPGVRPGSNHRAGAQQDRHACGRARGGVVLCAACVAPHHHTRTRAHASSTARACLRSAWPSSCMRHSTLTQQSASACLPRRVRGRAQRAVLMISAARPAAPHPNTRRSSPLPRAGPARAAPRARGAHPPPAGGPRCRPAHAPVRCLPR